VHRRRFLNLGAAALAPARTRLLLGGDIMLCRYIGELARRNHDPAFPFRPIAALLASADITFANLESPFSDQGRPVTAGMVFKAEPEMVEGLKLAGIDVVSTANNHARDRGVYGIEYTLRLLAANGIAAVGTGTDAAQAHAGAVIVRNGLRFGFLAYAQDPNNGNFTDTEPRVAAMDLATLRNDVAALRARADVVVVSMHGGVEYWTKPHPIQQAFARAAVEAGARIVVGHHPHVIQPWERIGNAVVFYSLGNLVFDQYERTATRRGLLAEVLMSGNEIAGVNTIPVEMSAGETRPVPGAAK